MKNLIRITNTSIDFNKLNKSIDKFECEKRYTPYIFMDSETIDEIIKVIGFSQDGLCGSKNYYSCGSYNGRKVFCDNTLNFGEIELR